MKKPLFGAFLLMVCWLVGSANAAPFLSVSNGKLTGAKGVNVEGKFYDVSFMSGTCIDLFLGCDAETGFPFSSFTTAERASQALLDQVLVDGPIGLFDSKPELMRGCSASIFGPARCTVLTPSPLIDNPDFGPPGNVFFAINEVDETLDRSFWFEFPRSQDTTNSDVIYAVWTPASAVPEAPTSAILVAGLLVIGVARRSQRKVH